jgi:hypothetical protein
MVEIHSSCGNIYTPEFVFRLERRNLDNYSGFEYHYFRKETMNMKILLKSAIVLFVFSAIGFGQFRSQPEARSSAGESLLRPDDGGLLFGWFDPSRLTMHNSYSLSYTTSGGKGYSLGALTSNLAYQISDPLSVQFDVSLLHSPYNNLGGNFANNLSGIYLTRAELNYRPSKNLFFQVQYRQLPSMYWLNNYDRFGFMPTYDRIEEEESH